MLEIIEKTRKNIDVRFNRLLDDNQAHWLTDEDIAFMRGYLVSCCDLGIITRDELMFLHRSLRTIKDL